MILIHVVFFNIVKAEGGRVLVHQLLRRLLVRRHLHGDRIGEIRPCHRNIDADIRLHPAIAIGDRTVRGNLTVFRGIGQRQRRARLDRIRQGLHRRYNIDIRTLCYA